MKNIILSIILLNIIGCVHSEISEGPEKMKTSTVWSSDLRLNYDSVYEKEAKKDRVYNYIEDYDEDYEVEERIVTLEMVEEPKKPLEIKEVDSSDIDKLIEEQMSLKIKDDQLKSKILETTVDLEEKREPKQVKWLFLLASFTTLGGFYSTIKKKKSKEEYL